MTQSDQTIIGLARKGDVSSITTIVNRRTHPKGINTRASIKGDCLQLLLESQEVPKQQEIVTLIQSLLVSLKISNVHRVKLYGRKKGEKLPEWNVEFEVVGYSSDQTPSSSRSTPRVSTKSVSTVIKPTVVSTKSNLNFGGSFQLSSSLPQTPEQQKISRSKAYEYGIGGAIFGLIVSLPSVWAAFQMLQIQGGGGFSTGYIIGVCVVVFIGYLSGFSQGLTQFSVDCPNCEHKFILSSSNPNCPACSAGLYVDEHGNCQMKQ